jgi:hypothetical protein
MADKVQSPYVGLVPYSEADARFFFGRERDLRRIIAQLFAARLTLLYGASGVGKSSLLRAGVVTELRRRARAAVDEGEEPDVHVVYFNAWQGDPVAGFREAVTNSLGAAASSDALASALAEPTLTGLVTALINALDRDLFLIFDQFEEFFLYHAHGADPGPFERDFAELATRPGLPVSLVISLRDDALSRLDHFKSLIPNLFANYVRVTHLSPDDARRAIVEPVHAYNALPIDQRDWPVAVKVEPALVTKVIDGVLTGRVAVGDLGRGQVATADAGVETPYLQLVMSELWRYERECGSTTLRTATLDELGGAEAIVQNHLDTTVAALTPEDRDTCARMFQYLVTPSGTKIAYTSEDLAGLVERSANEIELVLSKLSGSSMRILSPVAPPTDRPGPVRYEIYHDSLAQAILDWRRRYVSDREKTELERQRQEQERELQEELTRQREARAQAQRVAEAERARAETESLRVAEQRAAARRFKYAAAAALALAALALAAGGYAWSARGQALAAESRANRIQEEARTVAAGQEQLIASYQMANDAQQKILNELEKKVSGGAAVPTTNTAETERLRSEAAAYKEQLARLNVQATQIQRPKDDGQVEALQRDLDIATKRTRDLEGQLAAVQQLRVDLTRAQTDLASARDEVKRLEAANRELRAENERLNERLRASAGGGGGGGGTTSTSIEDAGVREALERYAAAHNNGAIAAAVREMSAVFPGYDVQQWARARRDYSSYSMTIDPANTIRYSSDGQSATVLATTVQRYQLVGGTQQERSGRMEFRLVKKGDTWTIAGAAAAK